MADASTGGWFYHQLIRSERFNRAMSRHLQNPSGLFGRWVARLMNESNQRMSERALDLLDIHVGNAVLEIGFGGGPGLRKMASLCGSEGKAVGLDRSPTMVARAQEKFALLIDQNKLMLVEGDVEHLRFPDRHFDGVVTTNTIYFWAHPEVALAQIFRVLKYGGRLVIGFRTEETMQKMPFVQQGFTLYTPERVRHLLKEAGFEQIRIEQNSDDQLGYVLAVAEKPDAGGDGLSFQAVS